MTNCSFCDSPITKGTGMLFVKKDGTLYHLCSSKCRRGLLNLGREGRRQKWTPAARKFRAGETKKAAETVKAKQKV